MQVHDTIKKIVSTLSLEASVLFVIFSSGTTLFFAVIEFRSRHSIQERHLHGARKPLYGAQDGNSPMLMHCLNPRYDQNAREGRTK